MSARQTHLREAARLRLLAANTTTPVMKTRLLAQAVEHERRARAVLRWLADYLAAGDLVDLLPSECLMPRPPPAPDPLADPAAAQVIAEFDAAKGAGLRTAGCYAAAIEAWRRAHPEHAVQYASGQAVELILKAKVSLRVDIRPPRSRTRRRGHGLTAAPGSGSTGSSFDGAERAGK